MAGGAAAFAVPGEAESFALRVDELLTDGDRRAEMGRAGRMAVEQVLAWEHQQAPYVAMIGRLARRGRTGKHQLVASGAKRTMRGDRA
jgi:hypothetical protein